MNKKRILFVDDEQRILDGLDRSLRRQSAEWDLQFALSGAEALEKCAETDFDLIVTDAKMPGMSGAALLMALQAQERTRDIPTIMLTGSYETDVRKEALDCGIVEFLNKPVEPQEIIVRLRNVLRLKSIADELRAQNATLEKRNEELAETRLQIIRRLGKAAEYKDNETGRHVVRVSHYSAIIAEEMEQDADFVELIHHSSPMHDIGKIGIPDEILKKPGSLDLREWEIMREHSPIGADVLKPLSAEELTLYRKHPTIGESILGEPNTPLLKMANRIAATHHERWDGSGYPHGLAGEAIPLEGRIVATADVYDALSSKRPYKPPFPQEECKEIITELRGAHLDSAVVDAFFDAFDKVREIGERLAD